MRVKCAVILNWLILVLGQKWVHRKCRVQSSTYQIKDVHECSILKNLTLKYVDNVLLQYISLSHCRFRLQNLRCGGGNYTNKYSCSTHSLRHNWVWGFSVVSLLLQYVFVSLCELSLCGESALRRMVWYLHFCYSVLGFNNQLNSQTWVRPTSNLLQNYSVQIFFKL